MLSWRRLAVEGRRDIGGAVRGGMWSEGEEGDRCNRELVLVWEGQGQEWVVWMDEKAWRQEG